MEVKCKRCGYYCEFDPDEGGYMTWCTECDDYPDADIDSANLEWWHTQADAAYKRAKDTRNQGED